MTTDEIQSRAEQEATKFAIAKQIRELLDSAAVQCPDLDDVETEILDLVTLTNRIEMYSTYTTEELRQMESDYG